jgi:hypothetical protein
LHQQAAFLIYQRFGQGQPECFYAAVRIVESQEGPAEIMACFFNIAEGWSEGSSRRGQRGGHEAKEGECSDQEHNNEGMTRSGYLTHSNFFPSVGEPRNHHEHTIL